MLFKRPLPAPSNESTFTRLGWGTSFLIGISFELVPLMKLI